MKSIRAWFKSFVYLSLGLGLSFSAVASADAGDAKSTVTIPLSDYLNLIKPKEQVTLTTIESAVLSGEFGEKLRLRISGTSVGQPKPEAVLQSSPQFMISKCTGSANVANKDQVISILAKESKFQVDCELKIKSWGELVFNFHDVLFVGSEIQGAESTVEGSQVRVYRKLKELAGAASEPTAVGRYQISVLPESTKFYYHFSIHNPNRSKKPYQLSLTNGESITQIKTEVEYKDQEGGKISLNLSPGENSVAIYGAISNKQWVAPLASSMQYLLIQNHPMLQLKIDTTAKRVSNEDSRMPASLASSRTYLVEQKNKVSWDVKKLEVIASTGYSVGQAKYNFYVPDEGPGLVEAEFSIQNRGTPELALEIPGKPVYLEVDSVPQVLAKDADGKLLTQISNGDHHVLVQYKTEKPFAGLLTSVNEVMVRPPTSLSNVSINVGFAKSWSALFGAGLIDTFSRFSWINAVSGLMAVLFLLLFFKQMELKNQNRVLLLVTVFVLHAFMPRLFYLTFFVLLGMLFMHFRSSLADSFTKKTRVQKILYSFGTLALALFLYTFGGSWENFGEIAQMEENEFRTAQAQESIYSPAPAAMSYGGGGGAYRKSYTGSAVKGRGSGTLGASEKASGSFSNIAADMVGAADSTPEEVALEDMSEGSSSEDFKGLPAKLRMPAAVHNVSFSQGLIDEKALPKVKVFAINPKFLQSLVWLCVFGLLGLIYRERKAFLNYLKIK